MEEDAIGWEPREEVMLEAAVFTASMKLAPH